MSSVALDDDDVIKGGSRLVLGDNIFMTQRFDSKHGHYQAAFWKELYFWRLTHKNFKSKNSLCQFVSYKSPNVMEKMLTL